MFSLFKRKKRILETAGEAPFASFVSSPDELNEAMAILTKIQADIQADMKVMTVTKVDKTKTPFVQLKGLKGPPSPPDRKAPKVIEGKIRYFCDMCNSHTRLTEKAEHCIKHGREMKNTKRVSGNF